MKIYCAVTIVTHNQAKGMDIFIPKCFYSKKDCEDFIKKNQFYNIRESSIDHNDKGDKL